MRSRASGSAGLLEAAAGGVDRRRAAHQGYDAGRGARSEELSSVHVRTSESAVDPVATDGHRLGELVALPEAERYHARNVRENQ